MGGLISQPAAQDIGTGLLGAPRNGAPTASEARQSQAFEQPPGASNGRRSTVYGPTGLHQVTSNNAALFVHDNAGPFSVDENASRPQHPTRTIAEAVGIVAGAVGVGAIYASDAAATLENGHGCAGEFGMNATRAGR